MNVFISWAGYRSRAVADALREWLPNVIQTVTPWMASADIEKGSRWFSELTFNLEKSNFGIICMTPENLDSPWLLYEAGALAKLSENKFICPYLFGFEPKDLRGQLVQFQAVKANKEDTRKLVYALNRALGDEALPTDRVGEAFDIWWPSLAQRLTVISDSQEQSGSESSVADNQTPDVPDNGKETPQTDRELLEQILTKLSSNYATESSAMRQRAQGRNRRSMSL